MKHRTLLCLCVLFSFWNSRTTDAAELSYFREAEGLVDRLRLKSGPPPLHLGQDYRWIQSYSFASSQLKAPENISIREFSMFHLILLKPQNSWQWSFAIPLSWGKGRGRSLFTKDAFQIAGIINYSGKIYPLSRWTWSFGVLLPYKQQPWAILPGVIAKYSSGPSNLSSANTSSKHVAAIGFPYSYYKLQLKPSRILGLSGRYDSFRFHDDAWGFSKTSSWKVASHLQQQVLKNLFSTLTIGWSHSGNVETLNQDFSSKQNLRSYSGLFLNLSLAYQFSGQPPNL